MAENLKQYLESHKCRGFNPVPHYFPRGDFVTYFFHSDRCHAQRVDDLLTVYLANGTDELVGCKVKGVKHILNSAGDFGVTIGEGTVKLGLFFWLGASLARGEEQRRRYEELRHLAKDAGLSRQELLAT